MIADAALDAQAEGADLARVGTVRIAPAARVAVAPRRPDAERRAGRHERGFEGPDQRPDHEAAARQGDDRIGDQLARAVVGHLAASLDADDLDPARGERRVVGQDVGRVGGASEGQDSRVLEEEQPVADGAVGALGGERLLEGEPLAVWHAPEPRRERSAPAPGSTRAALGASVSIATFAG